MSASRESITTAFGMLSFLRTENRGHRTALFVHGLGCSADFFAAQSTMLEPDFAHWLVPDLLGHGASAKPPGLAPYSMEGQSLALAELLAGQGTREVVLVAHSLGGPISLRLAERLRAGNAARVVGLVYAEGNIDANDTFMSARIAAQPWKAFESVGWPRMLEELAAEPAFSTYLSTLVRAGAWTVWASCLSVVKQSCESVTVPLLEQIAAPRLFLYGSRNQGSFTSEAVARRLGELRFVPESGHAMYEDNPRAFWSLVREFCSSL